MLYLILLTIIFQAKTAKLVGLVDVLVFAVAFSVTQFGMKGDMRIDTIGSMGAALNIVMYASPLVAMVRIYFIFLD